MAADAALTSLAERCPVPVQIDNTVTRRLPGPVEATLYYVVAEALTNVARYAGAELVTVRLVDHGSTVELEVVDDGVGGADASGGTGLLGLADRVAVSEGVLTVQSPPGRGTRIRSVLPVPPAPPPAPAMSDPATTVVPDLVPPVASGPSVEVTA